LGFSKATTPGAGVQHGYTPPAISLEAVGVLADETGSPSIALQFLADYLEMLPGRLQRILQGLHGSDVETTLDAILSLKTASAMAGAFETENYCRGLESLVGGEQFHLALNNAQALTSNVHCLFNNTQALLERVRDALGPNVGSSAASPNVIRGLSHRGSGQA
jgi:HPt (histidine-containing phosphotransfer) domain-containing protein